MARKQRVRVSLHAEMNALLKVSKRAKVDLFIFSFTASGELRNSKPCYHCIKSMKQWNIRYIFYSMRGCLIRERMCDMRPEDGVVTLGERLRR